MKLLVPLDQRFSRTPDGAVWTDGQCPFGFWQRYLEVFDEVQVVARVQDAPAAAEAWLRADGPRVGFAAVPHYLGLRQYLLRRGAVRSAVCQALDVRAAVLLRIGSQISSIMQPLLVRTGRPYGVEVVGDPHDVFAPEVVRHPLRPLLRGTFTRRQQRQCRQAATAAYVTRDYLQRRYPPGPLSFSTHYSDVELPPESFAAEPRAFPGGKVRVLTVGSLAQRYKGVDVLIEAVDGLLREGVDIELRIAGDGKFRGQLQQRAEGLGRTDKQVRFLGQLPGREAVREALQQADLFVLPSRVEGLPRALIEAMAAGLPCAGSSVGGIPELLDDDCLAPAGDAARLAEVLRRLIARPDKMAAAARRHWQTAQQYREEALQPRRAEHYRQLRRVTEQWLAGGRPLAAEKGAPT